MPRSVPSSSSGASFGPSAWPASASSSHPRGRRTVALAFTGTFFEQARRNSAEFSVLELVVELRAPKKTPVQSAEEHEIVIEVEGAENVQLEIQADGNAQNDLEPSAVGRSTGARCGQGTA